MLLLPAHYQKMKLLSMVTLFHKHSSTRIGRQRSPDRDAVIWLPLMTLPRSDGRQHDLFTIKLHQSESLEQEICNQRPSSKHRAGDICRCRPTPFPALPRDVMGFVVHHFAVHIGQDSGAREKERAQEVNDGGDVLLLGQIRHGILQKPEQAGRFARKALRQI